MDGLQAERVDSTPHERGDSTSQLRGGLSPGELSMAEVTLGWPKDQEQDPVSSKADSVLWLCLLHLF